METLVFEALENFKHFDDLELKCMVSDYWYIETQIHPGRLYNVLTNHYRIKHDTSTVKKYCETGISLALSTQNTKQQSQALIHLAWINQCHGDYFTAQVHANKAQRILQETSLDQDFYTYGLALLNLAEIDVLIGTLKEDVQRNCDAAKKIFKAAIEVKMCDSILADLYLRDGNMLEAKTLFERYIKEFSGICEMLAYCLERLGNFSCWGYVDEMSSQTTVFLVHSIKSKENLGIHKALQFLGDVFLQDDEYTAISLFTVALEGFTYMDVCCSRAECMLKLADISKGQGNLLKAVELWETARPLFERLAGVSKDVLEQHNKNLARLAKLNVSSTAVKDTNGLGANIEAMEDLELEDEKVLDVIAS
ncbi:hypothetical protein B0H13DRAFT_1891887 [Mycena leptocephala]|nr:hypothetical protein B0H13DRAFT_1891887 [Mycena leptocephala]